MSLFDDVGGPGEAVDFPVVLGPKYHRLSAQEIDRLLAASRTEVPPLWVFAVTMYGLMIGYGLFWGGVFWLAGFGR